MRAENEWPCLRVHHKGDKGSEGGRGADTGKQVAQSWMEKLCYDPIVAFYCEVERSGECRQPSSADDECTSSLSYAIHPSGTQRGCAFVVCGTGLAALA